MAGSFPDSFGRRMAWDVDGTVVLWLADLLPASEFNASERASINSEASGNIGVGDNGFLGYYCHIFPELRDLDGYFFARATGGDGAYAELETSVDTTNGIDGTWVQQLSNIADVTVVSPDYRNSVEQISVTAVKAIRVRKTGVVGGDDKIQAIHIYGNISSGQTPDRVTILDTDNSDIIFPLVLDYGDVPRGQTQTRTVKLRNNSSSKTINTITITAEDLFLNAGDWFTFGDDNISFVTTFSVGNLGPGATKLIYVKQIVPSGETLGLQAGRIKVDHATVV